MLAGGFCAKVAAMRCPWARNELAIRYHDEEWGVPVHDDRLWFEFITLEGAQAGLSWDTILRKREAYRSAFKGFEPARVAKFGDRDVARLLADEGIVRNRLKINSTIGNAKAFLAVQKEFGSFDEYVWRFVGGRPRINKWQRAQAGAGAHGRVGRDEQGNDRTRLQVRGIDHLLRDDAGDRDGERSPGRLREVQGGDAIAKEMKRC